MVLSPVGCPHCGSDQVVKRGKTRTAKQRYRCQPPACPAQPLIVEDDDPGYLPAGKKRMSAMAVNGSGIRDPARVLEISPNPGISALKNSRVPRIGQPSGAGTLESKRC